MIRVIISTLIATGVLFGQILIFPGLWAMCACTFNEMKSFLLFPGSLIGAVMVVFFATKLSKNKNNYWYMFFGLLLIAMVTFFGIDISLMPMSEYIDDNDIPIFQPEELIWDIPPSA